MRKEGRKNDQLRPVKIIPDYVRMPAGSALIETGNTRVVCTASIEERVPHWLHREQLRQPDKSGWITAEYSILPGAGLNRTPREATAGRKSGRTYEIQRMIGRSFRAGADLKILGARTIWIDCDVIQADGGTRSAAVTGGFVALARALDRMVKDGVIEKFPLSEHVAAVSVGILDGEMLIDLDYEEDRQAAVDLNVVMTAGGEIIEIQGTGERGSFSRRQLAQMLELADKGIGEMIEIQKKALFSK